MKNIDLDSPIMDIISDDQVTFVSTKDGRIVYFPTKNMESDSVKTLQPEDRGQYMAVLKLSRDKSFLVGYVDVDGREAFNVYNVIKKERIW